MRKKIKKTAICLTGLSFMFLTASASVYAQTSVAEKATAQTKTIEQKTAGKKIEAFKAGGTLINIPEPSDEMVEVGYDVREMMEVFVPASNRLLSGYMRPNDIPKFTSGDENFVLSRYASIQVARRGEYQDCTDSDFSELVDYFESSFSEDIAGIMKDSESELNQRMESLELEKITIDKPVQLGTLFSRKDAYSMGMISKYSKGTDSWTLVICTTFVKVKNRLLFIYVFNTYNDEKDIVAVTKLSEQWIDSILAANI